VVARSRSRFARAPLARYLAGETGSVAQDQEGPPPRFRGGRVIAIDAVRAIAIADGVID